MEVTVSIPDGFIPSYTSDDDLARQMLEAYAIENYRQETISLGRLAEILDLSIDQAHAFLNRHNVPRKYDSEDMERDQRTIEILLQK